MGADEVKNAPPPARVYKTLPIVADLDERPEHITFGLLYNGAFVPIAQHNTGLVEQMQERWSELGGTTGESPHDETIADLSTKVARLERSLLAAGVELDRQPAPEPEAHDET